MWESLLKVVAPVLGGAIGGPFGSIAVKALIDGMDDDITTEDQMKEAVQNASPETLAKLKQIDTNFKVTMKELGVKEKDIIAKDRDSARNMAIQTTLLPQMIISIIFITAFAVILYTTFTGLTEMGETQKTIVNILLGILSAGVVQVMNFWFGSSSGSKEKDTSIH